MQILISLALFAFVCVLLFTAASQASVRKGSKRTNLLAFWGFAGVAVIFALYFISIYLSWWEVEKDLAQTMGPFGDSFGPLTSLFSALAFAALIWTVVLQGDELQLSRKELALTRQEMTDQRFESMLMRMLEVHTSIVSDMDVRAGGNVVVSRKDCFEHLLMQSFLHRQHNIFKKSGPSGSVPDSFNTYQRSPQTDRISLAPDEVTMNAYEETYKENRNDLGHYFRSLYNILRFISESGREDKFDYARIVRAQLSDYELAINCLNCLSEHGVEKMKPLVEEFSILDNLPKDLYLSEGLMARFDERALKTPKQTA
ncbi:putative phage abortive infection protein [Pseudovibrio denitrificans]|uniref:putative phage abortive infection protein n=1 Tax=Pseudovibrio denitrificans TaxID=258256 RepID=UPI0039BFE34C